MSFKPIPTLDGTQANFTGNITSAGDLTVEGDITMGGSGVLTAVRTVTAGGNTLGAGETLAFGVGGANIKVTESAGAVTIAVDGSAELPTATIPNLAASKITSSTFADARISESSVTQHEAALTLVSGQITGALGYTPLSTETDDQTLDEVLTQGNVSASGITVGSSTISGAGTSTFTVDSTNSFGRELTLSTNGILPTISANSDLLIETSNSDTQIKLEGGGSTDNIQFVANEVERVRITTSGVAIGTTSPDYLLDIGGDTGSANNTIRMVQANNGTAIRIGAGGGSNDVNLLRVDGGTSVNKGESDSANFGFSLRYKGSGSGANNSLAFFADNSTAGSQIEALTILNDGKVGIGTTAPVCNLQVASGTTIPVTTAPNGSISICSVSGTTTPTILGRQTANAVGMYLMAATANGNTGGDMVFNVRENNNSTFATTTNSAFRFQHYTTNLLSILRNGDIGIGTTSPSSKLHISDNHSQLRLEDSDDSKFLLHSYSGGKYVVRNNSTSTTVNQFTLTEDGKFGIGTISPEQELHVYQGTAKFESTNGGDFSLLLGRSDVSNLWGFNHAGNDLRIYNAGGSGYDIMLGVNSGGAATSNKVGIGTASPSTALHVEGTITHKVYTVSALPSASPAGQRSFVSDASSVLDVNLGATVSAGGSNLVPVFSDGSNWIVG